MIDGQLSLLDPAQRTIQERFERFHAENPHVYEKLVELARQWQARGHSYGAIGMFWEVCRHHLGLQTNDPGQYQLNDHYRSRYARLIMAQEPDLAGFFQLRRLRSL